MTTLFAKEAAAVGYAHVAVERAVDRYPDGLTYAIPHSLADLQPGERVLVPLGRGDTRTPGTVVDRMTSHALGSQQAKFILKRDDTSARLPTQLLELARWISSYYCAPIGMTLAAMLPAAVKRNIGSVSRIMIDLGDPLPLDPPVKLPAKQRQVLQALAGLPARLRPIELRSLMQAAGVQTAGPIKKLVERKLLELTRRTAVEATWAAQAVDARIPQRLTDEQQRVVEAIGASLGRGFSCHLLFGVTGSGKTEVYIRLIQRVLERGMSALMLVPEISLTPQTGGRLIGRFPNHRVAVLHSGLTAAQRHQQWASAADGSAPIVLGARSAVFAPIPDGQLGLIVVDEEHDGSYKQDQAPRYHGRDVAIRRAQLARCPVVLGSATPSLESWHNSFDHPLSASDDATDAGDAKAPDRRSKYELHTLGTRAPGLSLPKVQVVDFRQQMRQRRDRRHVHLLGPALEDAIGRTLDSGGQVLLLLNRRGYASYIACPNVHCGWVLTCDHCDVTTVYHRDRQAPLGGFVRCHHCESEQKLPAVCPLCGSRVSTFGLGTQRVEEELSAKFPALVEGRTMLRMDSDSMHGSRSYHDALQRFGNGEVRLLVGTQMIAKGLDFPGVRLVGVINADTSINLPDFRASERTFQLVNQVAGRCGRGEQAGLTIVQTFNAELSAIRLAAAHDFAGFAQQELAERARVGLPPITRMARMVARDEDHVKCVKAAHDLAEGLRALVELDPAGKCVRIRGPAPCPVARIADRHRQQVEIIAPTAAAVQRILARARSSNLLHSSADLAIDVDPIALL